MDRSNDPRYNFYADPSLDEIIAQQGKGPVTDVSDLHGDFWPEDESIEDFLLGTPRVARPQEGRPRCMNSVVVDTDVISFIFKRT